MIERSQPWLDGESSQQPTVIQASSGRSLLGRYLPPIRGRVALLAKARDRGRVLERELSELEGMRLIWQGIG